MNFGLYLPNSGPLSDPRRLAELAQRAEHAGWDGLFIWDQVATDAEVDTSDPWVALAAVAMVTSRIRIGALVTPLPRRRPQKFAREVASLDQLSNGRLTVGIGLGTLRLEFDGFGEATDLVTRAAMLDEAMDLVSRLWANDRSDFAGTYYQAPGLYFGPPTLQQPRPPVWVAASWPINKALRRAARWDGVFPIPSDRPLTEMFTAREIREVVAETRALRGDATGVFDVVTVGSSEDDDTSRALLRDFEDAGVTWWLENLNPDRWGSWSDWPVQAIESRVDAGPLAGGRS